VDPEPRGRQALRLAAVIQRQAAGGADCSIDGR